MVAQTKQINVAVLIYPHVELLDMSGPMDVFNKANYFATTTQYNIYTVAEYKSPIYTEGGLVLVMPSYSITDCPEPDIIVIPGIMLSPGQPGVASVPVIEWITRMGRKNKQILSICIGVFTLVKTGLLAGKRATTHYESVKTLGETVSNPPIIAVKNVKYVDDGENIVTTGGITCGISGALYVVEKFSGPAIAQQTADVLVFNRDAPLPPDTILP